MADETPTEPLTDDMVHALRSEAATAGDLALAATCQVLLNGGWPRDENTRAARESVAEAITNARAMDDSRPFVRVVSR